MSFSKRQAVSRRSILAACVVGFAAAGALAAPALQLNWTRRPGARGGSWWGGEAPLHRAGLDQWAQQVGSEFGIVGEQGKVVARLAEIEPLPSPGRRPGELGRDRAFAAHFEAGETPPPGDRIYKVDHPEHGELDIYFSPSGKRMVAIFG